MSQKNFRVKNGLVVGNLTIDAATDSIANVADITATGNIDFSQSPELLMGSVSNLKITGGSANMVLITNGNGGLVWGSFSPSYANYANFSGLADNANFAGQANTSNFSGQANIAAAANSVALANVSGIGNIAVINLSGNASNVLYGNGVFAAPTGGSGSATFRVQEFTATANQTTFTIANTASGNVLMAINGVTIRPSAVSVSNVTVTYTAANNSSYALIANDSVILSYIYN